MASLLLPSQPKPVASFSFNKASVTDEISGLKAKLVNATSTEDRFGNADNAIYIHGSDYTYVNLGSSNTLKPPQGSISLWARMEDLTWSGAGAYLDPIIITKNAPGNDFYEAYAIYYNLYGRRVFCSNSADSTNQPVVYSRDRMNKDRWYHLVMCYSDTSLSLYMDGIRQGRVHKNFRTHFLEGDSVVLGHTANKKNRRFFLGSIDDVQIFDKVLNDREIQALYKAPNPNHFIVMLELALLVLGIIALLLLVFFYVRYRVRKAVKREREHSELANRAIGNELRVHRALMNPHFIFNTLNGLQDFILKKENDAANDYLVRFSQLLRRIMESNMSDSIPLSLEIELLKSYIEIESMRFEKEIICNIFVDPLLAPSVTQIPIMMLQPFVENAIWHGLLNKKGDKVIEISFELFEDGCIKCTIDDNGVGRTKHSGALGKKSLATGFIEQRLELINKINGIRCRLTIIDKSAGTGTTVIITLPFSK